MLVSDLMARVKVEIKDTQSIAYSTTELIQFINDAIHELNLILIEAKDPEMVKDLTIVSGGVVPTDFFSFAGTYPVHIDNATNSFIIDSADTSITARYFFLVPFVSLNTDTVPYKDFYTPILTKLSAIFALNTNELDMSQDRSIVQEVIALVRSGKRG